MRKIVVSVYELFYFVLESPFLRDLSTPIECLQVFDSCFVYLQVLDEEAEVFVVKMWRLLVYETEAKKLGLVK